MSQAAQRPHQMKSSEEEEDGNTDWLNLHWQAFVWLGESESLHILSF